MSDERDWTFAYEDALDAVAPSLHGAMRAWLSAVDSLTILDRRTHELIRMVCVAILRNPPGVERHARLAAEAGASWEEIACALLLTQPAFGLLPVADGLEPARRGFEAADLDSG